MSPERNELAAVRAHLGGGLGLGLGACSLILRLWASPIFPITFGIARPLGVRAIPKVTGQIGGAGLCGFWVALVFIFQRGVVYLSRKAWSDFAAQSSWLGFDLVSACFLLFASGFGLRGVMDLLCCPIKLSNVREVRDALRGGFAL